MIKKYFGNAGARFIRDATQHHERQLRELTALELLQFNLRQVGYDALLFPGGYAASASLLLEVFRTMETLRPDAVLECGSGESTGILAHYARRHPECSVVSLENQADWSASVERRFLSEGPRNLHLITAPLEEVSGQDGECYGWYKSTAVDQALRNRPFDIVLIDGPSGRSGVGRAGILSRLPDLISDRFVLYFDDADSALYRSDVAAIQTSLKKHKRDFIMKVINGEKQVAVFASAGLGDVVGGVPAE